MRIGKQQKETRSWDFLFYLAFILFLSHYLLKNIPILTPILKISYYIIPILLLFFILIKNQTFSRKKILIFTIIAFMAITTYFVSKNGEIIIIALFILAARGIDLKKLLKISLLAKIALTLFIFFTFVIGLNTDITLFRADGSIRHSLGFPHPNTLGITLACIVLELFYLLKDNRKKSIIIAKYISLITVVIIADTVCNARGAEFMLIIFAILNIVFNLQKNIQWAKNIILIPWLFVVISGLFVLGYSNNNQLSISVNAATSNRIMHAYAFAEKYNLTFAGNEFEQYGQWETSDSPLTVLDNAYMNIGLQFGIIWLVIILSEYSIIIKYAAEKNDKLLLSICISILCLGLMERNIAIICYYPFLIIPINHNSLIKDKKEDNVKKID